ncbi:hypothetical protein BC835DRAFT_1310081 [Cytidiella melzeri]|nr:hypothetical protein BC835DRAFT_1310081 [Cytidiella melzeri]
MSRQPETSTLRSSLPPEPTTATARPPSSELGQPSAKRTRIHTSVASEPAGCTLASERRFSVHTSQPSQHPRSTTQPPHSAQTAGTSSGFRNPFTRPGTRAPSESSHTSSTSARAVPFYGRPSSATSSSGSGGSGIPKVISDNLASLNDLLQGVQAKTESQDGLLKDARRRLNDLDKYVAALDETMHAISEGITEQDEQIKTQDERNNMQDDQISTLDNALAHLEARVADLQAALGGSPVDREGGRVQGTPAIRETGGRPAQKRDRTPLINGVIRAALRKLMGMETTHAAVPDALENGKFWTADDQADKDRRLRPHWDSWAVNADAWQAEFIETVTTRGHRWYSNGDPEAMQEFLKKVPEADIAVALSTAWTSLRVKYQGQQKDLDDKQRVLRQNRRRTRKDNSVDQKYRERARERDKIARMAGQKWNWFFRAKYQSSDHSEVEEVEGEGDMFSDNDNGPPAPKKGNHIFVCHRPMYRAAWVNELIDELDVHVRAAQNNNHRPIKMGDPVERDLPKRHGKQEQSEVISEDCVDPEWLAAHPDQHVLSRIQPSASGSQPGYDAGGSDTRG